MRRSAVLASSSSRCCLHDYCCELQLCIADVLCLGYLVVLSKLTCLVVSMFRPM